MNVAELLQAFSDDIQRIDGDIEDVDRQVVGLGARRERLAAEKAEVLAAMTAVKRKLMQAGPNSVSSPALSDADILVAYIKRVINAREAALQDALKRAGRIPAGEDADRITRKAMIAAGLVSSGRGWWHLPDASQLETTNGTTVGKVVNGAVALTGDAEVEGAPSPE